MTMKRYKISGSYYHEVHKRLTVLERFLQWFGKYHLQTEIVTKQIEVVVEMTDEEASFVSVHQVLFVQLIEASLQGATLQNPTLVVLE